MTERLIFLILSRETFNHWQFEIQPPGNQLVRSWGNNRWVQRSWNPRRKCEEPNQPTLITAPEDPTASDSS